MPRYLHYLSQLLCCLAMTTAQAQQPDTTDASDPYVMLFDEGSDRMDYAMRMTLRKAEVTGMLIVRQTEDGELRGAMMNEFGVSALNFSVSANRKKVTLVNVSALFDKWYIKRIVRNDLRILFQARQSDINQMRKRRQVLHPTPPTVTLVNHRHGIVYEFWRQKP